MTNYVDDDGDARIEVSTPEGGGDGSGSGTITRGGASKVGLAFAFAAASSAVVVAGAPWLFADAADAATFMVFWSALFTFSGILTGLSLEITRVATVARDSFSHDDDGAAPPKSCHSGLDPESLPRATGGLLLGSSRSHPLVMPVAAAVGLALGTLALATSPLWRGLQFPAYAGPLAAVIAGAIICCAVYHATVGSLAGAGRWGLYSGLITADSAIRVALVVAVALLTRSVVWSAAAAAAAFLAWVPFTLLSRETRAVWRVRADAPLATVLLRFGASALATGASALLVIGFPALLALTSTPEVIEQAAPLLLALTLTRAPLMIPLNAAQGVAIAHFTKRQADGLRAIFPILRIAVLVGMAAGALAWLLGPWLLTTIWGADFLVSGQVLAGLTIGATCLALLTLTGAVCQSKTMHQVFLAGWLAAVVVAAAILATPWPLEYRAMVALGVGPAAGIMVHLIGLRRVGVNATLDN